MDLYLEALKYDTPEEFVQSQGDSFLTGRMARGESMHRWIYPNVRGGWSMNKIQRQLRQVSSTSGSPIDRYIMEFNSPQEFEDNLYWHGTGSGVSGGLKPGIGQDRYQRKALEEGTGGGGYGEVYWTISLSKDKNMASNFTGLSSYGTVYPVILKKGAKVIEMPQIEDSDAFDETLLVDLWNKGIDAVKIGDWSKNGSEQELAVLNPRAIHIGSKEGESFAVYGKERFESPTEEQIREMWEGSAERYTQYVAENTKRGTLKSSTQRIADQHEEAKRLTEIWNEVHQVEEPVEEVVENPIEETGPVEPEINKTAKTEEFNMGPFEDQYHDYEPSWDYELDEEVEKEIKELCVNIYKDLHKNLVPQIPFFDRFQLHFVSNLRGLATYISGTTGEPVVLLDIYTIKKTLKEEQEYWGEGWDYDDELYIAIKASIVHELGHAIQDELDLDGEAFDENEAEDFSRDYCDTGEVVKFWEGREASSNKTIKTAQIKPYEEFTEEEKKIDWCKRHEVEIVEEDGLVKAVLFHGTRNWPEIEELKALRSGSLFETTPKSAAEYGHTNYSADKSKPLLVLKMKVDVNLLSLGVWAQAISSIPIEGNLLEVIPAKENWYKSAAVQTREEFSSKEEELKSFGVEIKDGFAILYRGTDVPDLTQEDLRYGDFLSSVETGYDITGNGGADSYGKYVVKYEIPPKYVEVTNGELQYKGPSYSLDSMDQKYPVEIYQAYNDYYGSNYTAEEIDKMSPEEVRNVARMNFSDGKEGYDAALEKHRLQNASGRNWYKIATKEELQESFTQAVKKIQRTNEYLGKEGKPLIDFKNQMKSYKKLIRTEFNIIIDNLQEGDIEKFIEHYDEVPQPQTTSAINREQLPFLMGETEDFDLVPQNEEKRIELRDWFFYRLRNSNDAVITWAVKQSLKLLGNSEIKERERDLYKIKSNLQIFIDNPQKFSGINIHSVESPENLEDLVAQAMSSVSVADDYLTYDYDDDDDDDGGYDDDEEYWHKIKDDLVENYIQFLHSSGYQDGDEVFENLEEQDVYGPYGGMDLNSATQIEYDKIKEEERQEKSAENYKLMGKNIPPEIQQTTIIDDAYYTLYHAKNLYDLRNLGRGTNWCFRVKLGERDYDYDTAKDYLKNGDIWVINKNGKPYRAVDLLSGQYMDSEDNPMNVSELSETFSDFYKEIKTNSKKKSKALGTSNLNLVMSGIITSEDEEYDSILKNIISNKSEKEAAYLLESGRVEEGYYLFDQLEDIVLGISNDSIFEEVKFRDYVSRRMREKNWDIKKVHNGQKIMELVNKKTKEAMEASLESSQSRQSYAFGELRDFLSYGFYKREENPVFRQKILNVMTDSNKAVSAMDLSYLINNGNFSSEDEPLFSKIIRGMMSQTNDRSMNRVNTTDSARLIEKGLISKDHPMYKDVLFLASKSFKKIKSLKENSGITSKEIFEANPELLEKINKDLSDKREKSSRRFEDYLTTSLINPIETPDIFEKMVNKVIEIYEENPSDDLVLMPYLISNKLDPKTTPELFEKVFGLLMDKEPNVLISNLNHAYQNRSLSMSGLIKPEIKHRILNYVLEGEKNPKINEDGLYNTCVAYIINGAVNIIDGKEYYNKILQLALKSKSTARLSMLKSLELDFDKRKELMLQSDELYNQIQGIAVRIKQQMESEGMDYGIFTSHGIDSLPMIILEENNIQGKMGDAYRFITTEDLKVRQKMRELEAKLWGNVYANASSNNWYKTAQSVTPVGECFPWAFKYATDKEIDLVHGILQYPNEPNIFGDEAGREYAHAWAEEDGMVVDWQTNEFRKPTSIVDFYELWNPKQIVKYSPEKALVLALRTGNTGPWTEEERNTKGIDVEASRFQEEHVEPFKRCLPYVQGGKKNWYKTAYSNENAWLRDYLKSGFDPYGYQYEIYKYLVDNGEAEEDVDEYYLVSEQWIIDNENNEEEIQNFKDWLSRNQQYSWETEKPPHESMDYRSYVKPTWLIHFTDDARSIADNGFEFGHEEMDRGLHLTTNKGERRSGPGYNFAFEVSDSNALSGDKYGDEAVVFWGDGVKVYHYGDEEDQVIFWGKNVDPRMIFPITKSDGSWVVEHPGRDEPLYGVPPYYAEPDDKFEDPDLSDVIDWVINNYRMLQNIEDRNEKKKLNKVNASKKEIWQVPREEILTWQEHQNASVGDLAFKDSDENVVQRLEEIDLDLIDFEPTNKIWADTVEKYKKESGQNHPVVHFDAATKRYLIDDGHHRLMSMKENGKKYGTIWVRYDLNNGRPNPQSSTHKYQIAKAIMNGENVPDEVLADYSDIYEYIEMLKEQEKGIVSASIKKAQSIEYKYHATSVDKLPAIESGGLLPSEKTNWGGTLGDFSLGKVMFTDTPGEAFYYGSILFKKALEDDLHSFVPVVLRVPTRSLNDIQKDATDIYVEHEVIPEGIEVLWDNKWESLNNFSEELNDLDYTYEEGVGVYLDWEGEEISSNVNDVVDEYRNWYLG